MAYLDRARQAQAAIAAKQAVGDGDRGDDHHKPVQDFERAGVISVVRVIRSDESVPDGTRWPEPYPDRVTEAAACPVCRAPIVERWVRCAINPAYDWRMCRGGHTVYRIADGAQPW